MGLAPAPGAAQAKQEHDTAVETAQQIVTIEYDGQEVSLPWLNVPLLEQLAVRKATGLPYTAFIESAKVSDDILMIDEVSFAVIWWLGRRAAGERSLDWSTAVAEWDLSKLGKITVSGVDDVTVEGDHPES